MCRIKTISSIFPYFGRSPRCIDTNFPNVRINPFTLFSWPTSLHVNKHNESTLLPRVDCEHCGRSVVKGQLRRHQGSAVCLKSRDVEPTRSTCSICKVSVLDLGRHKCTITKKKPDSETKNIVINNTQNNNSLQSNGIAPKVECEHCGKCIARIYKSSQVR